MAHLRRLPQRVPGCKACEVGMRRAMAARNDVGQTRRKLATHADDDLALHYAEEFREFQAQAKKHETAYLSHYAAQHGGDSLGVRRSRLGFEDAPTHRRPLPLNADMAQMLRDGEPIGHLAERLKVKQKDLIRRLNIAGWGPDGHPMHEEKPARLDLSSIFRYPPWMGSGLCAQTDPEAFFPERGGSTKEAKAVCRQCPVRLQCLQYALDNGERYGIYGGLSERERRALKAAS